MQLAIGQYNDVDFKARGASPDFFVRKRLPVKVPYVFRAYITHQPHFPLGSHHMKKASLQIRGFPCRAGLAAARGRRRLGDEDGDEDEDGEAGSACGAGRGAAALPSRSIPRAGAAPPSPG